MDTTPDREVCQARRDAHLEALARELPWDQIIEDFLARVRAALQAPGHPLQDLQATLREAPLEDGYECDGWVKYSRMRQADRLGRAIMRLFGEAQLAATPQRQDRPF
jgi:hypothetical protein